MGGEEWSQLYPREEQDPMGGRRGAIVNSHQSVFIQNLSIFAEGYRNDQNLCIPLQDHIFDYVDLVPVQIGFGLAYGIVFLLGVAANFATLRCLLTFRTTGKGGTGAPSGSSSTNSKYGLKFGVSREFLISLTLADLIFIGCTSLPLTAVHIFTRRWLLGQYACKIGPLLQGVGCFVTSFSLSAVALERYCMVTNGRNRLVHKAKLVIVVSIWVVASAMSTPLAFAYKLRRECVTGVGCFCGEFCDEIGWTSELDRTCYGIAVFVLQYVSPACVLAFCYYKVRRRVERGVRKRLRREHVSLVSQQRLTERKTRTSCMTLLLFAGFACPWLPMGIMNLLRDFNHLPEDWYAVAFAASHLMATTTILWNPVIYCWANRIFRSMFTNALFCGMARCVGDSCDYPDEDFDDRFAGDTATPAHTLSTLERSTRKRSDNTSYHSFRSARLSSSTSGRRSRLGTLGSLGLSNGRHRSSNCQQDAGGITLTVPTLITTRGDMSVHSASDPESVAI